ncbi:MAG TPA: hypothetical protein VMB80_04265 [Candidatus Acidoferrum sp.]|nr:hypothetical protein [Candidatus Acidoferrum sp.]
MATGTSGGAVIAAIMARALAYDFPSRFLGASPVPTGHAGNPLYDVWGKDLDLAAMLDTSDIGKDRPLTSPMPPLREAEAGAAPCRARCRLLHSGMADSRSGVSAEWG